MPAEKQAPLWRTLFGSTQVYHKKQEIHYRQHKTASCPSLMARSIRFHAWLCRLCGCLFIRDLFISKRHRPPRVVWKSWYTFYSIVCLSFLLWLLVGTLEHAHRKAARNRYRFDGSLHIIATALLSVKVLANIVSLIAGSSKTLAFYVRAAEFETRIAIRTRACCGLKRYFWSDVRRGCLLVVYCAAFAAAVPLTPQKNVFVDHRQRPMWRQVCIWLQIILLLFFYFVYDNIHIVMLRASGEVLVEYMKSQLEALEDCIAQKSAVQSLTHHSRNVIRRLEAVRLHFCEILELKDLINQVWNWSLVISTACTLIIVCTSAYEVCKNGPANWDNYAEFLYTVYLAYEFVTLAVVSQSLIDTGAKIKQACKAARSSIDDVVQYQIQYLHDCIDPEEMCLTGGAFFKLSMPLLVSMGAAIITHTVILVQTSQSSIDGFLYNSTHLQDVNATA